MSAERQAVERIEPRRREEAQRVPALSPGVADARRAVENHEAETALLQVVSDRKAGLTAADDDDVEAIARDRRRHSVGNGFEGCPLFDQGVEGHRVVGNRHDVLRCPAAARAREERGAEAAFLPVS